MYTIENQCERLGADSQKVYLENSLGLDLCVTLNENSDSKNALVILHGFGTDQAISPVSYIRDNYNDYSTVSLDFTGNGKSEGYFKDATFEQQEDDVKIVLDYLETKGYENITVIGHSMGAVTAIHMADDKRVSDIVLMACPSDPAAREKNWEDSGRLTQIDDDLYLLEDGGMYFELDRAYLDSWANQDLLSDISKINTSVLYLQGASDTIVPESEMLELYNAQKHGEKTYHLIPDADHFFSEKEEDILTAIKNWGN